MSLQCEPHDTLLYSRPLTERHTRTLELRNPHDRDVLWKFQTTTPKKYAVRPSNGRLRAGEAVRVQILRDKIKVEPPPGTQCKDKFLVASTFMTPDREHMQPSDIWSGKGEISEETKLYKKQLGVAYTEAIEEVREPEQWPEPATGQRLVTRSSLDSVSESTRGSDFMDVASNLRAGSSQYDSGYSSAELRWPAMEPVRPGSTPLTSAHAVAVVEVQTLLSRTDGREPSNMAGQEWVDRLDSLLMLLKPTSEPYGQGMKALRFRCRREGLLPSSCNLDNDNENPINPHYERIGFGGFSDVYKGRRGTTIIAIKSLRITHDERRNIEKSFRNEVIAWKCLLHPNIVRFIGISTIEGPLCLISEWMRYGNVREFLKAYPLEDRLKLAKQSLIGLEFMHHHDVVHGDLKGVNILVDDSRNARLADFGLTHLIQHTTVGQSTVMSSGTLRWMAPELLSHDSGAGSYQPTKPIDIYAIGMVFWELFTGTHPFERIALPWAVIKAVVDGVRPRRPALGTTFGLTDIDEVWSIMERCWAHKPEARPICTQVSVWLSNIEWAPSRPWEEVPQNI